MGPMAGSPREKSKVETVAVVEVGENWLWPPSRRSKVMVEPEGMVWMGGRALFHFWWMWEWNFWVACGMLGLVEVGGGGEEVILILEVMGRMRGGCGV